MIGLDKGLEDLKHAEIADINYHQIFKIVARKLINKEAY